MQEIKEFNLGVIFPVPYNKYYYTIERQRKRKCVGMYEYGKFGSTLRCIQSYVDTSISFFNKHGWNINALI